MPTDYRVLVLCIVPILLSLLTLRIIFWMQNTVVQKKVLCVKTGNGGMDYLDLTLDKLYVVFEDEIAERIGFVRIVDDSGEDYLYPSEYFTTH